MTEMPSRLYPHKNNNRKNKYNTRNHDVAPTVSTTVPIPSNRCPFIFNAMLWRPKKWKNGDGKWYERGHAFLVIASMLRSNARFEATTRIRFRRPFRGYRTRCLWGLIWFSAHSMGFWQKAMWRKRYNTFIACETSKMQRISTIDVIVGSIWNVWNTKKVTNTAVSFMTFLSSIQGMSRYMRARIW